MKKDGFQKRSWSPYVQMIQNSMRKVSIISNVLIWSWRSLLLDITTQTIKITIDLGAFSQKVLKKYQISYTYHYTPQRWLHLYEKYFPFCIHWLFILLNPPKIILNEYWIQYKTFWLMNALWTMKTPKKNYVLHINA